MKTHLISLLLLFIGFGQAFGQLSSQQKTIIEKQVDSVFRNTVKAAENLDFEKLSQSVDDKYKAGFITNGAYFLQFDSLMHNFKTRAQGISKQSISIKKEKISVLSSSIALLSASGNTQIETRDGNSFSAKFFWTFVYEKIGDTWKVVQSHQSSNRP